MLATWGASTGFNPASLFASGEQGAWYDPSNFGTMFQNSTGLTPVTAVEQPVGLIFDMKAGSPTARYNQLTYTEQFNDAAWTKAGVTVTADQGVAPDGTTTADLVVVNNGAQASVTIYQDRTALVASSNYTMSAYVKKSGASYAVVGWVYTAGTYCAVSYNLDTQTVSRSAAAGGFTFVSSTITDAGNGWYRIAITATTPPTAGFSRFPGVWGRVTAWTSGNPDGADTGNGTDGILLWGAQLQTGSTASTYQRITSGIGGEWTIGNNAYQSTSASRPTLRARYNLLTYSEQFDQGVWVKGSTTVVANNGVAPDGTTTADLLYPNSTGTNRFVWISGGLPVVSGGTYTLTVYAKAAGVNWLAFGDLGAGTPPANMPFFDLQNGVVGQVGSQFSSATITSVGGGWYRCSATGVRASTLLYPLYYLADGNNTATVTASGTNGVLLWGAQVFSAADQTSTGGAYQRIAAATDYVTVSTMGGTVFNPYLAFDGSDDSLLTNSVNFSGTDAMTVFAGVTKNSDAAQGAVVELSATIASNNGTFLLAAPDGATTTYGWDSKGTSQVDAVTSGLSAPTTNVVTGISDISDDSCIIRINGTQADSDTGDQGTGNFGNYPLFIGSRNQASLRFNGRLYQLIVRGAASNASQIGGTEQYVAGKTGVAL